MEVIADDETIHILGFTDVEREKVTLKSAKASGCDSIVREPLKIVSKRPVSILLDINRMYLRAASSGS